MDKFTHFNVVDGFFTNPGSGSSDLVIYHRASSFWPFSANSHKQIVESLLLKITRKFKTAYLNSPVKYSLATTAQITIGISTTLSKRSMALEATTIEIKHDGKTYSHIQV